MSVLTFVFMRQDGTGTSDVGEVIVAIYDRVFLLGPGFFAGLANGLGGGGRVIARCRQA